MAPPNYLSAQEAAEQLGVSRATLYAYVSRGLIRSEPVGGKSRQHRYSGEDVRRLLARKEQRENPAAAVKGALHFGAPVLESKITLIENGRLYYRGHDALKLARSWPVEEVAALIWSGQRQSELFAPGYEMPSELLNATEAPGRVNRLTTVERLQTLLPRAAAMDDAAYDLRPEAVMQSAARILYLLTAGAAGTPGVRHSLVETLQRGWDLAEEGAGRLLQAALILCADHELNVSSFTARCVASAGSTPYQVVLAGMAALQGTHHGGHSARVAALLQEVETAAQARATLAGRLRRGEAIPGFGHRLYPDGDPRAKLLLSLAAQSFPDSPALELAQAVREAASSLIGEYPNVDFGLATVARVLELPADAPLTLFALGRTIGWLGHAIEQYESGEMIRPRARYTGEAPAAAL